MDVTSGIEQAVVTVPYLIIDWVDGSTELAPEHLPAALDQMAQFLVGLHSLDPTSLQLPALEPIEGIRSLLWELYVSAAALATMGEWGLEPADEAQRRRRTERFFDRAARQLG